ncbi:MAG: hypothetical protein ACYC9J_02400 [Sulfuricaulis sp.]
MNPDESPFQLVLPIGRGIRVWRLDVDPEEHFRLRTLTHDIEQLFERLNIVMLKKHFAQMQHGIN